MIAVYERIDCTYATYMYMYYIVTILDHGCVHTYLDDDKHCRSVHVSIIVLAIYTFGTSLLFWWLYKKLSEHLGDKDDSEGNYVYVCAFTVYFRISIFMCAHTHMYVCKHCVYMCS